jgi:hypothetical protein
MHYSSLVIPTIQTSKTAVFITQQSETERRLPLAWLSDSTQGKQVICSVFSSRCTELPVACIVKQHLYFCTSDQLSLHVFFAKVRSHPSFFISYRRIYTRNFYKIWSRVCTVYLGENFIKIRMGRVKDTKRRVYLTNIDKFLVTTNKYFSLKACAQRSKSITLIVFWFPSLSVNKISQKSPSKVSENFPSIFP